MSHVPALDPASTSGTVRDQLDQINGAFGVVPAMFRTVANSPAALQSMWGSFGAFGGGTLGAALGEQIAVAIANRNACTYCLSAHTVLGQKAGVSKEAMQAAQTGESDDPRTQAILAFALKVVEERGQVTGDDVQALRDHGVSDEEIVEIIGHVALNLYTNYVNVALDVPVDFPVIPFREPAGV